MQPIQTTPGRTDLLLGTLGPSTPVNSVPPCNSEAVLGHTKWFHA